MPGPWLFFHHLRSSWSSMDIRVWWRSLYTAFTLTQGQGCSSWHSRLIHPHRNFTNTQSPYGCSPLIISDVQMSVDGEKDLLQKADPLPLFFLRLLKNGFHLLHVTRCVGCHILQRFLIVFSSLKAAQKKSFMMRSCYKLIQEEQLRFLNVYTISVLHKHWAE